MKFRRSGTFSIFFNVLVLLATTVISFAINRYHFDSYSSIFFCSGGHKSVLSQALMINVKTNITSSQINLILILACSHLIGL